MHSYSEILNETLANLPAEKLPEFIGELARASAEANARLLRPAAVSARQPDQLLSAKEAARRLSISTTVLYHRDYPFTIRDPHTRRLRFSANGIETWIAKQTQR